MLYVALSHVCQGFACRSQWPRGLRRRSSAARLLSLWVLIPPSAWMFVCCECCVLSGRGLCDGLITRSEESYRMWRVVLCDLETSWMRRSWPTGGCCDKKKERNEQINKQGFASSLFATTPTHDTHTLSLMTTRRDSTYMCYRMIHQGHCKVMVACRTLTVGLNSPSVNANKYTSNWFATFSCRNLDTWYVKHCS
jgi:hypothetical protein